VTGRDARGPDLPPGVATAGTSGPAQPVEPSKKDATAGVAAPSDTF